jgi:hypothetical protein
VKDEAGSSPRCPPFCRRDDVAMRGSLDASFALPCLPKHGEADEGKQRDAVVRWVRQHRAWLLILGNVDSEGDEK